MPEGKWPAQAIAWEFKVGIAKREPVQREGREGLTVEQLVWDKTAGEHITFEVQGRLMPGALARSFSQPIKIYRCFIVAP